MNYIKLTQWRAAYLGNYTSFILERSWSSVSCCVTEYLILGKYDEQIMHWLTTLKSRRSSIKVSGDGLLAASSHDSRNQIAEGWRERAGFTLVCQHYSQLWKYSPHGLITSYRSHFLTLFYDNYISAWALEEPNIQFLAEDFTEFH